MSHDQWQTLGVLAAVVAACASAWGACENQRTAFQARQATRAQVLLQLQAEYGAPEMFEAMRGLRHFQREGRSQHFALFFEQILDSENSDDREVADRIDGYRRRVSKFFWQLKVLTEEGIVDQDLVGQLWASGT